MRRKKWRRRGWDFGEVGFCEEEEKMKLRVVWWCGCVEEEKGYPSSREEENGIIHVYMCGVSVAIKGGRERGC
ncbi:hypothetical protein RchiOBHm_Chr2g0130261 [Rosa chinensis]|uniref:Uncharacterized protein n=1 Tax=Rosa chinensis TaxID=74649 RepID=A0A2P6RUS1_ROSCH|nr:hypothetical protein RchiOBHm_Chr2g0130261 [Rosa chinensis]